MWKGTQIITSTHTHTKAGRHTRVGKRECNLAPCLKSLFNCSARICACGLMKPGRQRWAEVKTCCVIASYCWSVCSGVYYENRTSVWLWGTGQWNGIALLSAAFINLTNDVLKHGNDKQNMKNWEVNLRQNTRKSLESSFLCLSNITPPILPASGWQRRWFILLRQRTSLTHTLKHTHIHLCPHTQEHRGLLSYTSH